MFLPCEKYHFYYITQEFAKIEANHSIYVTFTMYTLFQLIARLVIEIY